MIKAYILRHLLLVLALLGLGTAQGEEDVRYYDIELIVYENLRPIPADHKEVKPVSATLDPKQPVTLGQPFSGRLPSKYNPAYAFIPLQLEDLQLVNEANRIREAEDYRLLLHTGWRQPGLSQREALNIYFNHLVSPLGDTTTVQEPEASNAPTATQAAGGPAEAETPTQTDIDGRLQGIIKIILARYLHLDMELLYEKLQGDGAVDLFDSNYVEEAENQMVYHVKQTRRMRSKELHYIDHPVIGALVRITQFVPPEPVVPEQAVPAPNKTSGAVRR